MTVVYKICRVTKIRPSPHSVQARLPKEYQKYVAALNSPQAPVHYIPNPIKYEYDPLTKKRLVFDFLNICHNFCFSYCFFNTSKRLKLVF